MALSGVAQRLTAAEIAREPRSLAVVAWFAGNAAGEAGRPSPWTAPRRLTREEEESWREGWREGRALRVCLAWHGFNPCDGDHPPTLPT